MLAEEEGEAVRRRNKEMGHRPAWFAADGRDDCFGKLHSMRTTLYASPGWTGCQRYDEQFSDAGNSPHVVAHHRRHVVGQADGDRQATPLEEAGGAGGDEVFVGRVSLLRAPRCRSSPSSTREIPVRRGPKRGERSRIISS